MGERVIEEKPGSGGQTGPQGKITAPNVIGCAV